MWKKNFDVDERLKKCILACEPNVSAGSGEDEKWAKRDDDKN